MTAATLLAHLNTRGIRVSLAVGDLIVDAPVKRQSGDISLLGTHKDAVVKLLVTRWDAGADSTLPGRITITETPSEPPSGGIGDAAWESRAELPNKIPSDWATDWNERASVREHEGGMTRAEAEKAATNDVIVMMAAADEATIEALPKSALTDLEHAVLEAGHHIEPDGRFPAIMRPYHAVAALPERVVGGVRVPAGWSVTSWAGRLRTLADSCRSLHPDRAAGLRREANALTAAGAEARPAPASTICKGCARRATARRRCLRTEG